LNQQYWNGRRPRYCPSCLAATPYWRALWDITLVTACPIHCVELCDSCSRCNHPLSWKRARLTEIALRALQATLKAINADARAGIVMQTVGSGLSLSLMAYLALCKKHPALGALRLVVITETHAMMDQFLYAYHDLLDSEERRPLIKVQSGEEFSDVIVANPGALIATTGQRLLKMPSVFQDQCVVVGYNLRSTLTKPASVFPKGIFILFTSTYPSEQLRDLA